MANKMSISLSRAFSDISDSLQTKARDAAVKSYNVGEISLSALIVNLRKVRKQGISSKFETHTCRKKGAVRGKLLQHNPDNTAYSYNVKRKKGELVGRPRDNVIEGHGKTVIINARVSTYYRHFKQ